MNRFFYTAGLGEIPYRTLVRQLPNQRQIAVASVTVSTA